MNPIEILQKSDNWASFKNNLNSLSNRQKGDCFEALTKYYLLLHPTYTTQLKSVWLLKEVPPDVREKINLPVSDEGIDIIAETKYGTHWAIQCKYKEDENSSITRRELSTFTDLAFSICKNIELGLVCTSADRSSHKLKMHGDRLSFCAGEVWRALSGEFFDRLHSFTTGQTAPLQPMQPRPHQQRAIENAYKHFVDEEYSRGKMIMPCGTGKSLAGYWIAERLEGKKILVAVPSLALIRQTLEVWAKESVSNKRNINWIVVCSDASIATTEIDDATVLTQDLGVRIHTDPDEISSWLNRELDGVTVVFTTYQSGKATARAARKTSVEFDIGIMDEAHKTVGKADSLFSYLLFDENIKIKRRIFMTATERRYKGDSEDIISMEDPEVYGDTFELLTYKEALEIQPPILSDYKIVTIIVSQSEVAELIKRNIFVKPDKGKWDEEVEAEMLSGLVALRKAMKEYPINKAVSFHKSIARAKAFKINQDKFSDSFPEFGELKTFHVSGKTPTSMRAREVDEFEKAGRSLITNARCLSEGVDIPNIDCILFSDSKKSTVDIVQATGRALRPYPGKKYGYVIVPVLLEEGLSEIDVYENEAFSAVLTVLRALAADDDRVIEYFRSLSQGIRHSKESVPIDMVIPKSIAIDVDEFIDSVELQLWSRLAKLSWRPFHEAREFALGLGLKNSTEWRLYCKGELISEEPRSFFSPRISAPSVSVLREPSGMEEKPEDIPACPHITYKNKGWTNWADWLGTKSVRNKNHLPFYEAREFALGLGLKSSEEWSLYCAYKMKAPYYDHFLPENIPRQPHRKYKNQGWVSWNDWLGYGDRKSQYRSFKEARRFARSLGITKRETWVSYCSDNVQNSNFEPKLPNDIPKQPKKFYKDTGWYTWGDWLGYEIEEDEFLPFEEAREFVQNLMLGDKGGWNLYCDGNISELSEKPKNIPKYPHKYYKGKGWVSWKDWFGRKISP
jgi:superfamily II DNA or RNA helicase